MQVCAGAHGGVRGTGIEGEQSKIALILSNSSIIVKQNKNEYTNELSFQTALGMSFILPN